MCIASYNHWRKERAGGGQSPPPPAPPGSGEQNRRCAVPSAYPLRLPGRARGNIPVKRALSPHPCGLPRPSGNASAILTPPNNRAAYVLIHLKYEKNREDIGLFGIWRD